MTVDFVIGWLPDGPTVVRVHSSSSIHFIPPAAAMAGAQVSQRTGNSSRISSPRVQSSRPFPAGSPSIIFPQTSQYNGSLGRESPLTAAMIRCGLGGTAFLCDDIEKEL